MMQSTNEKDLFYLFRDPPKRGTQNAWTNRSKGIKMHCSFPWQLEKVTDVKLEQVFLKLEDEDNEIPLTPDVNYIFSGSIADNELRVYQKLKHVLKYCGRKGSFRLVVSFPYQGSQAEIELVTDSLIFKDANDKSQRPRKKQRVYVQNNNDLLSNQLSTGISEIESDSDNSRMDFQYDNSAPNPTFYQMNAIFVAENSNETSNQLSPPNLSSALNNNIQNNTNTVPRDYLLAYADQPSPAPNMSEPLVVGPPGGVEAGIISYLVQPTNGLYEEALYDYVIDAAKLLPADVVLEPTTYWFVSPIELEIQRSPLIQLYDSIQYKEYYLYRVSAAANGHAEFCDTSGNLYAQAEWFFNYGNPSEESLSRVQDTLGGNDSSSKSDAVRQDMWNKFTQTDQYKQLTNNSDDYNNNISYGYSPPSFTELPDSLKFLVRNDTKATQRPQSTTATHQSGGYNTTASHQSGIYNYPPASNSRATHHHHQSGPLPSSGSQIHRLAENNLDNSNRNGHHIPFSQIKQGKFIGEGTFGRIYFAEYNNQTYAIKQFKNYVDNKEEALNEVTAYMKLRHKQIVSLVGITTDPQTDEIMLVMEYMENGSLHDLLAREKVQLSREAIIRLGLDIAKGVHFLHSQKIMHRDLKSANVLLYDNKKRAKLSDFGAARIFKNSSKTSTVKGTLGFMAPEVLNEDKPYGYKADVYSFGVLLYHMLTLTIPPILFKDLAHASALIKEQVKDLKFQELIIHCCKQDPDERLSIDDCIASLVKMQYEIKP